MQKYLCFINSFDFISIALYDKNFKNEYKVNSLFLDLIILHGLIYIYYFCLSLKSYSKYLNNDNMRIEIVSLIGLMIYGGNLLG